MCSGRGDSRRSGAQPPGRPPARRPVRIAGAQSIGGLRQVVDVAVYHLRTRNRDHKVDLMVEGPDRRVGTKQHYHGSVTEQAESIAHSTVVQQREEDG